LHYVITVITLNQQKGGAFVTLLKKIELFHQLLDHSKWNDLDWSKKTGISRQTFWRIRNNHSSGVENKTVEIMARALGKSVEWEDHTKLKGELIDGVEDMETIEVSDQHLSIEKYERIIENLLDQNEGLIAENNRLKQQRKES